MRLKSQKDHDTKEDTATEQNFVNTLADYIQVYKTHQDPPPLKPTITKNVQ